MLKKWHVKAVVQKVISLLPWGARIHRFVQQLLGTAQLTDTMFGYKVGHARDHVETYRERHEIDADTSALELGTGWFPVVPIYLFLCGFDRIASVDTRNWLSARNFLDTIAKYRQWQQDGELEPHAAHIRPDRWETLLSIEQTMADASLDALCRAVGFEPIIADARALDSTPAGSVDLICSNNTFEHIPADVLRGIVVEFTRVLNDTGVMSHHIDMSDHWAHADSSIDVYNFLRYGDRAWSLINNSLGYQNRLRFVDYKRLYDSVGVPYREKHVKAGHPGTISTDTLAPAFREYSSEDLAIVGGYLVTTAG